MHFWKASPPVSGGRRRTKLEVLAVSLAVLLASGPACSAFGAAVLFSTLAKGLQSGVREPIQLVIRTRAEWAAFWARHARGSAAPPPVDFSRDMVVALFMGERGTGGYEIEITRVERVESGLVVQYRRTSPDPGAMLSQALSQPFHLVKLPRNDGPVIFVAEGSPR